MLSKYLTELPELPRVPNDFKDLRRESDQAQRPERPNQERAVGVLERVLGLDAAETIHAYAQLGQFLHYAGTGARGICFLEQM